MLSCKDVTELLSKSMDASLPVGQRIGVRFHLFICAFCARYRRQLFLLRETVRRLGEDTQTPVEPRESTLSEEARERIRRSLREP